MREQDGGGGGCVAAEAAEDALLGVSVHAGQRVVENEDRGPAQQSPRNRRALFLPPGQRYTALAHNRFIALWKLLELGSNMSGIGGFKHLFQACVRPAEGEIFADGATEKESLLRNHPN